MKKELQIFKNKEFGEVRTLEDNGRIYFCGSDIAKSLGYVRPNDAISQHCRATVKRSTPISGKMQEINFIPEGDVYRLITRSKLPTAEKFEKWVFDEVLPSIRKTGGYVNDDDAFIHTYLPFADETTKLLFKSTLAVVKNQNDIIEKQKPLVDFANKVSSTSDLIDIGRMAKLLKDEHINIGRNRLFEWLRDKEILMKNNTPYQRYIDGDYFQVKEGTKETAYGTKIFTTTYVTGKGQIYITEKLRKELDKTA